MRCRGHFQLEFYPKHFLDVVVDVKKVFQAEDLPNYPILFVADVAAAAVVMVVVMLLYI